MYIFRTCRHALSPISFFCLTLLAQSLSSCSGNDYVREEGMVWNTIWHVTYKGSPSLRDSVLATLDEVGKSLSVFDSTSLVSKVNRSVSTVVDKHFQTVYNTSKIINGASAGMFDPTLSPLITAWGFGPGHKMTADTVAADSILAFVGIGRTHLVGDTLVKDDVRTQFNYSAVAKGYGCDMVAEMLGRNGVTDYLVEIGGEIAAGGVSPRGNGWSISIDAPEENDSSVSHAAAGVITITDAGIATSGNYRNFHKRGNATFGHTISPVTGRPVTTDVISATVVAPTCMEADAAATACMAAGSEIAMNMLRTLRYEGMLILSDSTLLTTPGFNALKN